MCHTLRVCVSLSQSIYIQPECAISPETANISVENHLWSHEWHSDPHDMLWRAPVGEGDNGFYWKVSPRNSLSKSFGILPLHQNSQTSTNLAWLVERRAFSVRSFIQNMDITWVEVWIRWSSTFLWTVILLKGSTKGCSALCGDSSQVTALDRNMCSTGYSLVANNGKCYKIVNMGTDAFSLLATCWFSSAIRCTGRLSVVLLTGIF